MQPLKSAVATLENKRFFFDLGSNDRGRYLKSVRLNCFAPILRSQSELFSFPSTIIFTFLARLATVKSLTPSFCFRVTVVVPTTVLRQLRYPALPKAAHAIHSFSLSCTADVFFLSQRRYQRNVLRVQRRHGKRSIALFANCAPP